MTNKEIHDALIKAKEIFINDKHSGICIPLKCALKVRSARNIVDIIPEYIDICIDFGALPYFFTSHEGEPSYTHFWWHTDNQEVRLQVFDHLIKLYGDIC